MSDEETISYEDWPKSPQQREAQARDLFGQYLVSAHDAWLTTANDMLFSGYRYKSPSPQQKEFLDWIASLPEEDRHHAFEFVRNIISGVMFSTLNKIDGNSGSIINDDYFDRIHIFLEICRETYEAEDVPEVVEAIPINTPEEVQLHNLWYVWLAKFSRWK